MYKLVVFDLDGTIADTICDLANAVNTALTENKIKPHSVDEYRYLVGNGVDRLIYLATGSDDEELLKKVKLRFSEYYDAHKCDFTKAYDGISELLDVLSSSGIKTAVLSNKPHNYIPEIVSALYKNHHFDYLWGQRPEFKRKPDAGALNALISLCNVTKAETLYVGDSDVDVLTAHNAGVKAAGVEWGFRGRDELLSAGADFIVKDSHELLNIIMQEGSSYEY